MHEAMRGNKPAVLEKLLESADEQLELEVAGGEGIPMVQRGSSLGWEAHTNDIAMPDPAPHWPCPTLGPISQLSFLSTGSLRSTKPRKPNQAEPHPALPPPTDTYSYPDPPAHSSFQGLPCPVPCLCNGI